MKRPLATLTLVFCLGIFVARNIRIPFLLVYSFALLFLAASFLSFRKELRSNIFLFCLFFCLGTVLLKNSQILPKYHISKFTSYKNNAFYIVKGFINSPIELKSGRVSFVFKVRQIQTAYFKQRSCGYVLVYIKTKRNFRFAEELILTGNLYRPYSFSGRKHQSYRDYLNRQDIFSIMQAKTAWQTGKLDKGLALRRFALWLKEQIEGIFFKYVSSLPASILDAMVLGEKRNIPPLIYNSMIKSGTVHILVVSGFNVGIVSSILILFLKLIRIPRGMRFYITAPLLIIYCFMTGASTPVVRATVMAIFFMFGSVLKREPDIYNSCALAAVFILGLNPRQLFDVGFELSFVSVISIVYLYPKIKSLLRSDFVKIKTLKFLIEAFLVSFSAWLGTMGFIAYYFRIFAPVTVLANVFIVPLATLITLCGFSLIIIALVLAPLAPFLASSTELITTLLLNLNALLIKIPRAYFYLP